MTDGARSGDRGGYVPLRDYAVIGDCHGAALVSREGDVDWCALERFDADPIFFRILDERLGGFLRTRPTGELGVSRGYEARTNILVTHFDLEGDNEVRMIDFFPVGRTPAASTHDYVTLRSPSCHVRRLETVRGEADIEITWKPGIDWGRHEATLVARPGAVVTGDGPVLYTPAPLAVEKSAARGRIRLEEGEVLDLVTAPRVLHGRPGRERIDRWLAATRAFWSEWADYCRYRGSHREQVLRSALALKLLTYAPSGAICAAVTTSLPEEIGGERNWDYRFCWLRDTSFTLYALSYLGYSGETIDFLGFLDRICIERPGHLQIMYGIEGETQLEEKALEHLEGYRRSRPVRIGNAAYGQKQLDVRGGLLAGAHLYRCLGGDLGGEMQEFLADVADQVAGHWCEPDQGIWEMRGPPRHHVFGKVMCWVALDRAIQLLGGRSNWEQKRDEIQAWIEEEGRHPEGWLRQAPDVDGTDAALLLVPTFGYPLGEEGLGALVGRVDDELRTGPWVRRYRSDDGLRGEEGAFLPCSFWLVDALLLLDRHTEARDLFDELLGCANDLGLYSEEIRPADGAFLGNFPQGLTHLSLVQSASLLELYEEGGREALAGSHADRVRRAVGATVGWKAIWESFRKTGRVGRIWPSRASVLRDGEDRDWREGRRST